MDERRMLLTGIGIVLLLGAAAVVMFANNNAIDDTNDDTNYEMKDIDDTNNGALGRMPIEIRGIDELTDAEIKSMIAGLESAKLLANNATMALSEIRCFCAFNAIKAPAEFNVNNNLCKNQIMLDKLFYTTAIPSS